MTRDVQYRGLGRPATIVYRWLVFFVLLYFFLVAIQVFSTSIKLVGGQQAAGLFEALSHPLAGLAVGILATVLVQSSSVTTSLIVGMVGTGEITVAVAVPMIMGANIGTSITNTLVSLFSLTRHGEFRRAFAGATVHDFFNFLTVLILLPLEMATRQFFGTGILEQIARWLATMLPIGMGGKFDSPIKAAVKWCATNIQAGFEGLGFQATWLAVSLFVTAMVLIILTLTLLTKNMKLLMADRIQQWFNRVLERSGTAGLVIGVLITVGVQSSSVTTSLLIPMFGAGVLTLEAGFPIMVGANIGTTITALIAALVAGQAGLIIALVHLLFNLAGTMMFLPMRATRQVPIRLARGLAELAMQNRLWVVAYIVGVFIVMPVLAIVIFK